MDTAFGMSFRKKAAHGLWRQDVFPRLDSTGQPSTTTGASMNFNFEKLKNQVVDTLKKQKEESIFSSKYSLQGLSKGVQNFVGGIKEKRARERQQRLEELEKLAKSDVEAGVWSLVRVKWEIERNSNESGDDPTFVNGIEMLPSLLSPKEEILAAISGAASPFAVTGGDGCCLGIVTNFQLIIFKSNGVTCSPQIIPYETVSSVNMDNGITNDIIVYDGATKHKIPRIFGQQEAVRIVGILNEAIKKFKQEKLFAQAAPPQQPAANPGAGADDNLAKIERLWGLMEKGILSKEEFEAQKAKLLSSI